MMLRRSPRFAALTCLTIAIAATCVLVAHERRREWLNDSLIASIIANDTHGVVQLLGQGADANARKPPRDRPPTWRRLVALLTHRSRAYYPGDTALITAIQPPDNASENQSPTSPAIIEALLKSAADPNARDKYGLTPLMIAAGFNRVQDVSLLLHYRANLNAVSPLQSLGGTALMYAVLHGRVPNVKLLLDKHADVNKSQVSGQTPLCSAVISNDVSMVKLLLDRGADPNKRSKFDNRSLLRMASFDADDVELMPLWRERSRAIAQMLKKAGARD